MSAPDAPARIAVAVQLPAPDVDYELEDDVRRQWNVDVDGVRAVTIHTDPDAVDVRIERGQTGNPFRGVHARTGQLTPDDADRFGRALIAAAADARTRSGR